MKNAFRSASSIHHKKVLVMILRCKVLVLVLNTRLGLGLEIKVLVLKKVLITSLVYEGRDWGGGEKWAITPSKSKTKLPLLSMPMKILAGFLYFTLAGWHWHIKPRTQLLVQAERLEKQMHSEWMHSVFCTFVLFFCIILLTRDLCFHSCKLQRTWYQYRKRRCSQL